MQTSTNEQSIVVPVLNHTLLYKNHGSAVGTWEGWTEGSMVCTSSAKTLTAKAVQNCYECQGKNIGKTNETTPAEQALRELDSKIRLKLDKGYVLTREEAEKPVTNTLGLSLPMLATPIEKVKPERILWNSAFAQPKLDGHRALYKDGVLYSRQGKELKLPHIIEAIKNANLNKLHLDGELYIHGVSLQDLSRLIKKPSEGTLDLKYHIYDIVADLPFALRTGVLKNTAQQSPALELVETIQVDDLDTLDTLHEDYRAAGYEGTMLRYGTDSYTTGKRSRTLLKLKEFHDDEFMVVWYEEGKPYIKGDTTYQVPVWTCQTFNGKQFNVTAAGTMQEKHSQWENRRLHVGNPLTVKYHYLSKDGIPQLPIALRWREDV